MRIYLVFDLINVNDTLSLRVLNFADSTKSGLPKFESHTFQQMNRFLYWRSQGLIQSVFDSGIPISGSLTWACRNIILSKTESTIKRNPSFLSNQQHNVNIITRK